MVLVTELAAGLGARERIWLDPSEYDRCAGLIVLNMWCLAARLSARAPSTRKLNRLYAGAREPKM